MKQLYWGALMLFLVSPPPPLLPVVPQCRNIIKEYIVYLQTEFGKKVILPTDKPGQDINSVPIKAKPSGVSYVSCSSKTV